MKTSHILFVIALFMGASATFYTGFIGNIKMTTVNKPINSISTFWLKCYDIKVTQDLPHPIKHIKVTGGNDKNLYLKFQKNQTEESTLFSVDPQNFSYEVVGDSLLIQIKSSYANITLQQNAPIASIEAQEVSVNLNSIVQEKLHIAATDKGRFSLSYPFQRNEQQDSIGKLTIRAANAANVFLDNVAINTSNALMDDAVLHYTPSTQMDSLAVHLQGRSSVTNDFNESRIAGIHISGNKKYFKKELLGKDAPVILD